MLEAHYAVPMLGAVLCPINIRLDAGAVAFILQHSEAKVVLVDRRVRGDGACADATRWPQWWTSTTRWPAAIIDTRVRNVHRRRRSGRFRCGCRTTSGRRSR